MYDEAQHTTFAGHKHLGGELQHNKPACRQAPQEKGLSVWGGIPTNCSSVAATPCSSHPHTGHAASQPVVHSTMSIPSWVRPRRVCWWCVVLVPSRTRRACCFSTTSLHITLIHQQDSHYDGPCITTAAAASKRHDGVYIHVPKA